MKASKVHETCVAPQPLWSMLQFDIKKYLLICKIYQGQPIWLHIESLLLATLKKH